MVKYVNINLNEISNTLMKDETINDSLKRVRVWCKRIR